MWFRKLCGNHFESEEIGRKQQLNQAKYIDTDELVYDIRIISVHNNVCIGVLWHDSSIRHVKIIAPLNENHIDQIVRIKVNNIIGQIIE